MNSIQLFTALLTLMITMLGALGYALYRMSADSERSLSQTRYCRRCRLALETAWMHCPLCGQAAEAPASPREQAGLGAARAGDIQPVASTPHSNGR